MQDKRYLRTILASTVSVFALANAAAAANQPAVDPSTQSVQEIKTVVVRDDKKDRKSVV